MKKGNKIYFLILGMCFAGLIFIQSLAPRPINWTVSYTKDDKIPYGTEALYTVLPSLFPKSEIITTSLPIRNTLKQKKFTNSNYFILSNNFAIDTLEMNSVFNFVKAGNNVFIAANYFEGAFADSLKLKVEDPKNMRFLKINDTTTFSSIYKDQGRQEINFGNPALKNSKNYTYTNCFSNNYFSAFDTSKAIAIGYSAPDKINFLSVKMGKGVIFLSTVPEAFCNYNIASSQTLEYATKALSYLPEGEFIWDEYYKPGSKTEKSILYVILGNPALALAYAVLMLTLLLFILVGIKRKQRIIPVIRPLQNTTLQFVDVVGSLYYQTKDHKNISEKKITYFNEYLRHSFQVKTNNPDEFFFERIVNLSGIDKEKITSLFSFFNYIHSKEKITEQELLKLNALIEEFHLLNKR